MECRNDGIMGLETISQYSSAPLFQFNGSNKEVTLF